MALQKYYNKHFIEAGLDEAGRGCLVGPVVAAAVILPKKFHHPLLDDSKKVSEANRLILKKYIQIHALSFSVQFIPHNIIDEINILQAAMKAMHLCVHDLKLKPELLLIDGNYFNPYFGVPHHCIVKGDSKFMSIAAASILAKTYRDDYMQTLDKTFPQYAWKKNKGYGTRQHIAAILEYGESPYQRKSFSYRK